MAHVWATGNDTNLVLDSRVRVGGGMRLVLGIGADLLIATAVLGLKRWLGGLRKGGLAPSTSGDDVELCQRSIKRQEPSVRKPRNV